MFVAYWPLLTHTHGCPARDNDVRQFCTEEIVEGRVVNGWWSSRFLSFLSSPDWPLALQEAKPPNWWLDALLGWAKWWLILTGVNQSSYYTEYQIWTTPESLLMAIGQFHHQSQTVFCWWLIWPDCSESLSTAWRLIGDTFNEHDDDVLIGCKHRCFGT